MMNLLNQNSFIHAARAIKVVLALMIAFMVYRNLNLSFGYWIAITAVITIRTSTGASIKLARERLTGTVTGIIAAAVVAHLFAPNSVFVLLLVPILIFFAVYLFYYHYGYSIFFGTLIIMIFLFYHANFSWTFIYLRLVDTLLGILLGLFLSYGFWRNTSDQELRQKIRDTIFYSQCYLKQAMAELLCEKDLDLQPKKMLLEKSLLESMRVFREFTYEPNGMKASSEAVYAAVVSLDRIYNILLGLDFNLKQFTTQFQSHELEQIAVFYGHTHQYLSEIICLLEKKVSCMTQLTTWFIERINDILVDENRAKAILTQPDSSEHHTLFITYLLKKLATELVFLQQSVEQMGVI